MKNRGHPLTLACMPSSMMIECQMEIDGVADTPPCR
jgi:hypothetical protein